jgi:hypothetical protein
VSLSVEPGADEFGGRRMIRARWLAIATADLG